MKKWLLALFTCLAFSVSAFAAPINLNTATTAELESLKGVGPVKAQAIVDYRTQNGEFKSVNDLEKVSGFGKKTVDSLRGNLIVSAGSKGKVGPEVKKDVAPDKVDSSASKKDEGKKTTDKK